MVCLPRQCCFGLYRILCLCVPGLILPFLLAPWKQAVARPLTQEERYHHDQHKKRELDHNRRFDSEWDDQHPEDCSTENNPAPLGGEHQTVHSGHLVRLEDVYCEGVDADVLQRCEQIVDE